MADNRVKYAYLNYDDIQKRIESGEIDQYDIVFTKDTHEQYFIKDDLSLLRITSKVYCFDSVSEAELSLNNNTDTYAGQIVAIANNDTFSGYIVNKVNGKYTVDLLSDNRKSIDYDSIEHRPVINKTGTQNNILVVGNLDNGLYSIDGVYKIFEEYPTVFTVSSKHLFLIEKSDDISYIKDISAKEIIVYTLSNGKVTESKLLTSQYLEDNQYITNDSFEAKLKTLDLITKTEASEYIKTITNEYLEQNLGNTIDTKIDEKIQSLVATDSDIENLFQ